MSSALWLYLPWLLIIFYTRPSFSQQDIHARSSTDSRRSPSQNSSATPSDTNNASLFDMSGDAFCTATMCVGVLVNGSVAQYTLQSRGASTLGWMAIGFGTGMVGSPMVIMWPNADGSVTLSQRIASRKAMPTVEQDPPFIATVQPSLSSLNGSMPKLVYTTPLNPNSTVLPTQDIIWAYGARNPDDSAVDANIMQHIDYGTASLDLAGALNSTTRNPANPVSHGDSTVPSGGGGSLPLLPFQKMLVAHGVLTTVGFLVLLPFGALIARFTRTFTHRWFKAHWIVQSALAFPIILVGFGLGVAAVSIVGAPHFDDTHQKWGLVIFLLYIAQLVVGALIHYIKPKRSQPGIRRPAQNFFHAILGIIVIGLSFYQVRTGFRVEWPLATGRSDVSNAANVVWYIWIVLIPVLYLGGLALLRRQFSQEVVMHRERLASSSGEVPRGEENEMKDL